MFSSQVCYAADAVLQRTERRKRHASIMQAATSALQQRRLVAVWLSWLEYVAGRQQRQQLLQEVSELHHYTIANTLIKQRACINAVRQSCR